MLQRTNSIRNGRNGSAIEDQSSDIQHGMVSDSSSSGNYIDRQSSALNRRILPHGIDGRSAPAKRLMGLVRDLAKRVDDPEDTVTRARLVAAALLIMQQESMAHDLAAGKTINCEDVVRVANATERALARLS